MTGPTLDDSALKAGRRSSVIFLTDRIPREAGDGSERRAFQSVVALAAQHHVYAMIVGGKPDEAAFAALAAIEGVASVRYLNGGYFYPPWYAPFLLPLARFGRPWRRLCEWVLIYRLGALRAVFGQALPDAPIERVHVLKLVLCSLGAFAASRYDCQLDIDLDDWESAARWSIARLFWRRGRMRDALEYTYTALECRVLEDLCLPGAGKIYVAAPEDAVSLSRRYPQLTPILMPNRLSGEVTPIPCAPVSYAASGVFNLLFVGGLNYFPNEDAALFLAEEINTALQSVLGRPFRITICGREPPPHLVERLKARPNVDVFGDVESLAPHYQAAHAAVIPLRGGGGTKYKLIEAFQYGKPVISTAEGVRGMKMRDGVHFLAAHTAAEFAAACRRLIDDPALAQRLCDNGRRLMYEEGLLVNTITSSDHDLAHAMIR